MNDPIHIAKRQMAFVKFAANYACSIGSFFTGASLEELQTPDDAIEE